MKRNFSTYIFILISFSYHSYALNLEGTIFHHAAERYSLDPLLLYAVALAESASGRGNNRVAPWAWTLRTNNGAYYAATKKQAIAYLEKLLLSELNERKSIDVGLMQINLFWHGHRVEHPIDLLDPLNNITIGAEILSETIKSAPNDLELGIGRYHHWSDEKRTRWYAKRVLSIYNNLTQLGS